MSASDENKETAQSRSRLPLVLSMAAVAGIVAGLSFVFLGQGQNEGEQVAAGAHCKASAELAKSIGPLVGGQVAALQIAPKPGYMGDLAFQDAAGKERRLEEWKGKGVLLNLWATWCAPCRKEMPDLDELQAKMGGDQFEVVAVSIDRKAPKVAKDFLDQIGTEHLALYSDSSMKIFNDLKTRGLAFGMPTTLVLDKEGCAVGYMAGPAPWAGEEALRLLQKVVDAQ